MFAHHVTPHDDSKMPFIFPPREIQNILDNQMVQEINSRNCFNSAFFTYLHSSRMSFRFSRRPRLCVTDCFLQTFLPSLPFPPTPSLLPVPLAFPPSSLPNPRTQLISPRGTSLVCHRAAFSKVNYGPDALEFSFFNAVRPSATRR